MSCSRAETLAALDEEISQRALWIRPRLDPLLFIGQVGILISGAGEEDGSFGFDNKVSSFELTRKDLETAIAF